MSTVMRQALERRKARILDLEERATSPGISPEGHGWKIERSRRGRLVLTWEVPADALLALRALRSLRALLGQLETDVVMVARHQGLDWATIGWGLGITRQSAHQRHAGVDLVRAEMPPDPF